MTGRHSISAEPGLGRVAAYGGVALPLAALLLPLYVYLPAYYGDDLGLGLAAVGAVLLLARAWDIVTDPLIGWLSDRLPTRWGRRRPWLVLASPLLLLAVWQLLVPGDGASLAHLAVWSFLLYLAATMVQAPYAAWGAELCNGYDRRTTVTTVREAFTLFGTVTALTATAVLASTTADALQIIALLIAITLPLAILLAVHAVPDPHRLPGSRISLRQSWQALRANRPFQRLITAYLVNGVANGLPATLFLLFVGHVLGRDDLAGPLLLAYFVAAIAGAPLWLWLSRRLGKHRAWSIGMLVAALSFTAVPFLGTGDVGVFLAICLVSGLALGADLALPPAIQADVVDIDTAATGRQRAGLFFGLWNMATKLALALAVGFAFPLLDLAGFKAGAETQSLPALTALGLLYGGLPVLCKLVAVALVWHFPRPAVFEEGPQPTDADTPRPACFPRLAAERM